jgi:DNA ligase (NAD+)
MSSPLKGKYICFTGKLDDFTRADLEEMAEEYGFTFMNSVTKSTDILVKGEKPGKTKVDKAFNQGVRIISAEDFLHLLMANDDLGLPEPKVKETKTQKKERLGYYEQHEQAGIF